MSHDFDLTEDELLENGALLAPRFRRALDQAPLTGEAPALEAMDAGRTQSRAVAMKLGQDPDLVGPALRVRYGWGLPTAEILDRIVEMADGRGILEVGSGCGYWAAILSHRADVLAVDIGDQRAKWRSVWREPEPMRASEALARHPDRLVLSVWPNADSLGQEIVEGMRPGVPFVMVGPRFCTGSEAFHAKLDGWFDDKGLMRTSRLQEAWEDVELLVRRETPLEVPRRRTGPGAEHSSVLLRRSVGKFHLREKTAAPAEAER